MRFKKTYEELEKTVKSYRFFTKKELLQSAKLELAPEIYVKDKMLFHGTSSKFLDNIKEHGLLSYDELIRRKLIKKKDHVPENSNMVYLANSYKMALEFAKTSAEKTNGKPVVLSIKLDHFNNIFIDPEHINDEYVPVGFMRRNIIKPSEIEKIDYEDMINEV